jgi:hypothetical protein
MNTKICSKCNLSKDLTQFYYEKRDNRYSSQCKDCRKERWKTRMDKPLIKKASRKPYSLRSVLKWHNLSLQYDRRHLDALAYLQEVDREDKAHITELHAKWRHMIRQQEPWFLEIVEKYREF